MHIEVFSLEKAYKAQQKTGPFMILLGADNVVIQIYMLYTAFFEKSNCLV